MWDVTAFRGEHIETERCHVARHEIGMPRLSIAREYADVLPFLVDHGEERILCDLEGADPDPSTARLLDAPQSVTADRVADGHALANTKSVFEEREREADVGDTIRFEYEHGLGR